MVRLLIQNGKFFLLSLAAAWSIGISIRFLMLEGPTKYTPNVLDRVLDWGGLLVLGLLLLVYCIHLVFKEVGYAAKKN